MLISKMKEELGMDYYTEREEEIEALALVSSSLNIPFCIFIEDEKYIHNLNKNIKMVITTKNIAEKIKNCGVCITLEPRILFFKLHNLLCEKKEYNTKTYDTLIGLNCEISHLAHISSKNVTIGNNVIIEEFVSIKENTIIEDNVIIRSGSIIAGQGFEFKREKDSILSVRHIGSVIIKKNAEIRHNCAVDKGIYPWDSTIIGENSKIDNLIHIAHGAKIKRNVLIAALTCVAGRVVIEDNAWVGPGVSIVNGMELSKGCKVSIGAVVTKNVNENERVTGNFAIEHTKFINLLKKNSSNE